MSKIIFLGTKGEIEESSEKHRYHASLLFVTDEIKILIDYGRLRKYSLEEIAPDIILITHAHPDAYAWLEEDIQTPVPIYLTRDTYDYGKYHPANFRILTPFETVSPGNIMIYAYPVVHSTRCPTVGYRLTVNGTTLVYNSDVVDIPEKERVLTGATHYIGDGSAIKASLVRRHGDKLFGHTRITTQINWCLKYGIKNIIFTHIGKEVLEKETEFQKEHPEITIARDGMEIELN